MLRNPKNVLAPNGSAPSRDGRAPSFRRLEFHGEIVLEWQSLFVGRTFAAQPRQPQAKESQTTITAMRLPSAAAVELDGGSGTTREREIQASELLEISSCADDVRNRGLFVSS